MDYSAETYFTVLHILRTKSEMLNLLHSGLTLREVAAKLDVDESTISKAVKECHRLSLVDNNDSLSQKEYGAVKYPVLHYRIGLVYGYCMRLWSMMKDDFAPQDDIITIDSDAGKYFLSMSVMEYCERCLKFAVTPSMRKTMILASKGTMESTFIQDVITKEFNLEESTVRGYLKELVDLGLVEKVRKGRQFNFKADYDLISFILMPYESMKKSTVV